jgi:hypothetical protein
LNSPEIKALIREYKHLFWYTPESEKENISHELLIEMIFNYGDMDAVKKLFNVMGRKQVARVFFNTIAISDRRRNNFNELALNFFTLVLQKDAC